MTADDLNAPLGQSEIKRRRQLPISLSQVVAGALALFLAVFVTWTVVGNDPFGGEPTVVVPIDLHTKLASKKSEVAVVAAPTAASDNGAATKPAIISGSAAPPAAAPPPNTRVVTIIDGKTGARQEVVIPAADGTPEASAKPPLDQKFVEMTAHGPIPKIAADGTRPAEAFARPMKVAAGKADMPRVALIVAGLGVSASATADAIAKLPSVVTLGFMPYSADVGRFVARARGEGHEVLLQVPMEPFGYPDNDSGPQTLLTSLTPEQNLDRLYWLMSRFQAYVGLMPAMGARFTGSETSFDPILREIAKRGLIFVDDGSNPRSVAGRIAGADNLPFAKADAVLDQAPTPVEIDRALTRLEIAAREHGAAVGVASALPVSIKHVAEWAKTAESRGLLLVPITAIALKAKQS